MRKKLIFLTSALILTSNSLHPVLANAANHDDNRAADSHLEYNVDEVEDILAVPLKYVDLDYETFSLPTHEHPGSGTTYQLVTTIYGDSHLTDKFNLFVQKVAVALALFKVNPKASVVAGPFLDTFAITTPKKKYYTTKVYGRIANGYQYSKLVVSFYSDSARTKLITTKTRENKLRI